MPIDLSEPGANNIPSLPTLLNDAIGRCTVPIIEGLAHQGIAVIPEAIPVHLCETLRDDFRNVTLTPAAIGRAGSMQRDASIRSDTIAWMDGSTPTQLAWLDAMEQLRCAINRELFVGLFDYECHYAHYQPGQFYRRHRDAFVGNRVAQARVLSTICYLTDNWQPADAGELMVYDTTDSPLVQVAPLPGTLVIFLSEQFPHEVLPTNNSRYSIAGWFRRS